MSSSSTAPAGGPQSGFEVHLAALLQFGDELRHQYDGLVRCAAALTAVRNGTGDVGALGDFPEARMLQQRHHNAAADLAEVLGEIGNAMDYASRVTHWVATQYARSDEAAAAAYLAQSATGLGHQQQTSTGLTTSSASAGTSGPTVVPAS